MVRWRVVRPMSLRLGPFGSETKMINSLTDLCRRQAFPSAFVHPTIFIPEHETWAAFFDLMQQWALPCPENRRRQGVCWRQTNIYTCF